MMSKGKHHLAILLFLTSVASVSFAFVPSARAQVVSDTSSTTKLCSQVENTMSSSLPKWFQHEISITAPSRGCHLITSDITKAIQKDISSIKIGMANLFIQRKYDREPFLCCCIISTLTFSFPSQIHLQV